MKNSVWVALLLFATLGFAQQQGTVSGNITDLEMNDEPLMFAQVEIRDTDRKANTNLNGNFEIAGIEPGKYVLAISYAGYETKDVPIEVKDQNTVTVHEGLSAKSLEVGALLESVDAEKKTRAVSITSLDNAVRD